VTRHITQDTGPLDRDADCVVPGVVSEAWGDFGAEESGVEGSSLEDSLVGGCEEGVLGAGEDGAVEVGGQGLAGPEGVAPLDVETQGDGEVGAVGGGGVDTLTDGEGLTGGWVLWSLPPVSPRCRAIQS
jgi:hypothetical protein